MFFIKPLSELQRTDLALAGGKGANLGALIHAGMPVPPGFVVTTDGYRAFVAANGLGETIHQVLAGTRFDDPASLEAASAQIRQKFQQGQVPAALAGEILDAYRQLSHPLGPSSIGDKGEGVAVRSSATAEDLPDLSFAGQQDTYLNIAGEAALLDAVVRCWASLWTARAIGYRAHNRIGQEGVLLAVVVQQMVASEASGVLFTANPLTGKRTETVIDATLGLGEALVSGQVEPDHYVVENDTITSKGLGSKALTIHRHVEGGTQTVHEDLSQRQALPDEHILALAQLGQQAATAFGEPQDMEWAFAGGRLYVVQSRPITSLFPALPGAQPGELLVGISFGAVQGMLDPMTPMGRDVFRDVPAIVGHFLGMSMTSDSQRALLVAGERLWINVTTILRNPVGRRIFAFAFGAIEPGSVQALPSILNDPRLQGGTFRPAIFLRLGRLLLPILFNSLRNLANPAAGRKRIQKIVAAFLSDVASSAAAARTLQERIDITRQPFLATPSLLTGCLLPAVVSGQIPFQLLIRMASGFPQGYATALELTRGLPHNVTTEMDLALWHTARTIQADAVAAAHFAENGAAALAGEYLTAKLPATAQAAVADFLSIYGVRGVAEIDLGRPRWRDDPTGLFQVLKSYLQIEDEAASPEAVFRRGEAAAAAAEERLLAMFHQTRFGAFKAHLARKLVARVRALTGLRETPKFTFIRAMGIQRQVLLESGRDLVTAGILASAEDVFFLHLAELQNLAQNLPSPHLTQENRRLLEEKLGKEIKPLVAQRLAVYEREMRRKRVPRVLLSDGRAFYDGVLASASQGGAIAGSPVSPGVVEGIVHVIRDPHSEQLVPGEILVCPGTDPAWTPLFLAAGGLVMEVGGMMTHGSVVAREYGIPAVVGVHQATTRLKDGQRIRVDGSRGTIEVLDR
ncbi:MAG: PEP/pyruvate-binding domain-containing protein [Chloroflexota bacterium]